MGDGASAFKKGDLGGGVKVCWRRKDVSETVVGLCWLVGGLRVWGRGLSCCLVGWWVVVGCGSLQRWSACKILCISRDASRDLWGSFQVREGTGRSGLCLRPAEEFVLKLYWGRGGNRLVVDWFGRASLLSSFFCSLRLWCGLDVCRIKY